MASNANVSQRDEPTALSDFDFESLEISDFLDESRLADSETIATVMSASCTTCECCCSCSS